jgi:hypothetical protein
MFLEWFRGVLALTIKCLKAVLTAVTPRGHRRSTRPRRRG